MHYLAQKRFAPPQLLHFSNKSGQIKKIRLLKPEREWENKTQFKGGGFLFRKSTTT